MRKTWLSAESHANREIYLFNEDNEFSNSVGLMTSRFSRLPLTLFWYIISKTIHFLLLYVFPVWFATNISRFEKIEVLHRRILRKVFHQDRYVQNLDLHAAATTTLQNYFDTSKSMSKNTKVQVQVDLSDFAQNLQVYVPLGVSIGCATPLKKFLKGTLKLAYP